MTPLARRRLLAGALAAAWPLAAAAAALAGENRGLPGLPGGAPALPAAGEASAAPAVGSLPALPQAPEALNLPASIPAAAAAPQAPSAPVGERLAVLAEQVAPEVRAAQAPATGADASAGAGRSIQAALSGEAAIPAAGAAPVPAAAGAGASPLAASGAGSSAVPPAAPPPPGAPAVQPARKRGVESRFSYGLRRMGLASIAAGWGLVYSLPQAGPKLSAALAAEAGTKRALVLDYDNTLAPWGKRLPADMGALLAAARRAGKIVAIVSDRPALGQPGDKVPSLADSLSELSPEQRAGLIVASRSDAVIFRYDARGEIDVLHREPPLSVAEYAGINAAVKSVLARAASLGVALHREDPGSVAYSLIFKPGASRAAVNAAAALMRRELAIKGVAARVEPRFPADPTKEPYLNVIKVDKSWAVSQVARLEGGIKAEEAVFVGDSFYDPQDDGKAGLARRSARRLALRLSGRPLPASGYAGDADMEKALPGALTLAVGETADPRMDGAFVLAGKGPEAARAVLAAATKPVPPAGLERERSAVGAFLALLLLLAVMAVSWYVFYHVVADIIDAGSRIEYRDPFEGL